MPQGVIVAVRPIGRKSVSSGSNESEEDKSFPLGCHGLVEIQDGPYAGASAYFVIKGDQNLQRCCSKGRGDKLQLGQIYEDKDGIIKAEVVGC